MEIALIVYLSREIRRQFCHLFDILKVTLAEHLRIDSNIIKKHDLKKNRDY